MREDVKRMYSHFLSLVLDIVGLKPSLFLLSVSHCGYFLILSVSETQQEVRGNL